MLELFGLKPQNEQEEAIFTFVYYAARIVLLGLVIGGISFLGWINTDRYVSNKIMSSCLGTPATMNSLIHWNRKKHEFLIALKRELLFLGQWFKYHDNPSDEDILHYAKRSLNDEDFFAEKFTESEKKLVLKNAVEVIRFHFSIQ